MRNHETPVVDPPKHIKDLVRKWPSAIVAREKVAEFSGGLLHPRTMANLASLGQGPPFIRVGHKVCYHVDDLCRWMASRIRND